MTKPEITGSVNISDTVIYLTYDPMPPWRQIVSKFERVWLDYEDEKGAIQEVRIAYKPHRIEDLENDIGFLDSLKAINALETLLMLNDGMLPDFVIVEDFFIEAVTDRGLFRVSFTLGAVK